MKKVIFVCLLSLSVCFSQALDAAPQTPAVVPKQNASATDVNATAEAKPQQNQTAAAGTPATPPVVTPGAQNATAANVTQAEPESNETSTKSNETKPTEKNNSTETKPSADPAKPVNPAKPVDPAKEKNETKPSGNVPANNGTNADSKDGKKNETTTPKNVSPTVAPVEAKSRAFDGPSFIGGIILTLGLLAIGFMGFKYYKNQTERNYHTL